MSTGGWSESDYPIIMRDETPDRDVKKQQRQNEELLGECLKHLRVYLRGLSESAWATARESKRQEEYQEMCREERRMNEEQYPCDEGALMNYDEEFEFEWM